MKIKKTVRFIAFPSAVIIAIGISGGCAGRQGHFDSYFEYGSTVREADAPGRPADQVTAVRPAGMPVRPAAPPVNAGIPAHGSLSLQPEVVFVPWSSDPPLRNQARVHTVREGDTLTGLARQLYGEPGRWQLIYQANRNLISDPDNLPAGIRLKIP